VVQAPIRWSRCWLMVTGEMDAVFRPNPTEPAVGVAEDSKQNTTPKRVTPFEDNTGNNSGHDREPFRSKQVGTAAPPANLGAQVFGAIAEALANASTQTAGGVNNGAKNDAGAALGTSLLGGIARIAVDRARSTVEAESNGSVDAKVATLPQIKAIQSNLDLDQVDSSDREQFGLFASRIDVAAKSLQALERQQSTPPRIEVSEAAERISCGRRRSSTGRLRSRLAAGSMRLLRSSRGPEAA